MPAKNNDRERRLVCMISLVLLFGTLACYWQVGNFNFINLDDGVYVAQEPMVQNGFSWSGIKWAFQTFSGGNWNPLIWFSHMADSQVFGLSPEGHHITNLLLHVANVLLLFFVLKKMTKAIWPSAFAAAIFAWHPMHVESVAWISERKDVLSTLFWLLTMWAYAEYVQGKGIKGSKSGRWYVVTLLFFILGLMCKSMLVTLPFVLLLLDYWPLARSSKVRKTIILEKIPFFALSIASSALAVWSQQSSGSMNYVPMSFRLENVLIAYATYLEKFFYPVNLAVFYPYPKSFSTVQILIAILIIAVISAAVIWQTKRQRYLAVGWCWFLGTLVPVIGVVQIGMQSMADRYTYVPYIGLAMMLSWGAAALIAKWPKARIALAGAGALGLGCFLCITSVQVGYWRENKTIYDHVLAVTSGNYIAHSNLGNMYMEDRQFDEAFSEFKKVVELVPDVGLAYLSLGTMYGMQNKLDDAIEMLKHAIALDPNLASAHFNLGNAYLIKGMVPEGMAEIKKALELNPRDLKANLRMADALARKGQVAGAFPYFKAAVELDPNDAHAQFGVGQSYLAAHNYAEAVHHFKIAVRLSPDAPECLNALAWVEATSPKSDLRNGPEAVQLAEQAVKLTRRRKVDLLDTLAAAYAEAGRFDDAIKVCNEMLPLTVTSHESVTADIVRQRLELYRAGKPYRDED